MTDVSERLSEIRERTEAATKGPWKSIHKMPGRGVRDPAGNEVATLRKLAFREGPEDSIADARFIASARSDVPWLLSLVEEKREVNERALQCAENALSFLHDDQPGMARASLKDLQRALRDAAQEGAE